MSKRWKLQPCDRVSVKPLSFEELTAFIPFRGPLRFHFSFLLLLILILLPLDFFIFRFSLLIFLPSLDFCICRYIIMFGFSALHFVSFSFPSPFLFLSPSSSRPHRPKGGLIGTPISACFVCRTFIVQFIATLQR